MPGVSEFDLETLFVGLSGTKKCALAVSGGPDSLALMLLAERWARSRGTPELVVYTVDHGLRAEAREEAAMVLREAARLGLPARVLVWQGDKPETGIQAAARKARYAMMAAAMADDGAELLLTAHHLRDQAETVLMRLAHGSGIDGLRGMDRLAYVEGCEVYRPLLAVDPAALLAVVEEAGLAPAHDPSNSDRHYERVRWRELLPQLEAMGVEPRRLGKFAERMAAASALVAAAVDEHWPQTVIPLEANHFAMPRGRFAMFNPLVGSAMLARVLQLCSGDRRPPPLGAVESLAGKLAFNDDLKPTTLHGCVIEADAETIRIRKERPRRALQSAESAVTAD
ncbi:MAG: tRNA lysidine(34) synthetase TilS [Devosia sp.]